MISNSKIDKIGDVLKEKELLDKSDYQNLLEWRNGFSTILDYYHTKLKSKIREQDIVSLSRRLKRIESIQIKLRRFKTMRLSTLQDIAGIRVVLKDEAALQKAFSTLRGLSSRHTLKRVDNYHNTPKPDGYRGFHLIYQNEDNLQIEVQLRTELEHIWATAVEIYGELQETSFKTGTGNDEWKNFFALLSSYFAIKENSPPTEEHLKLSEKQIQSRLKKMIKDLNVIERLNASTNSIKVITSKFNQSGRTGKYAIIELDLISKTTTVELFNKKDVNKAIEIYTRKEFDTTNSDKKNIVFVNVDNIEKIQNTYPNYFLNTNKLLEILSKIALGIAF
jgi:ppGpp synthetase/RelA/SpoT-type nucleotidyltranferase